MVSYMAKSTVPLLGYDSCIIHDVNDTLWLLWHNLPLVTIQGIATMDLSGISTILYAEVNTRIGFFIH